METLPVSCVLPFATSYWCYQTSRLVIYMLMYELPLHLNDDLKAEKIAHNSNG